MKHLVVNGQLHVSSDVQPVDTFIAGKNHYLRFNKKYSPFVNFPKAVLIEKYSEFHYQSKPQCIMIFSSSIFSNNNNTCSLPHYCGAPVVTKLTSGYFYSDYLCYGSGYMPKARHQYDQYTIHTRQQSAYTINFECPDAEVDSMQDTCDHISSQIIVVDHAANTYRLVPPEFEPYAYRCAINEKCIAPTLLSTPTGYCLPYPTNNKLASIDLGTFESLEELLKHYKLPIGPVSPNNNFTVYDHIYHYHSRERSYKWRVDGTLDIISPRFQDFYECQPLTQTQYSFYNFGTFIYRTTSHIILIILSTILDLLERLFQYIQVQCQYLRTKYPVDLIIILFSLIIYKIKDAYASLALTIIILYFINL